MNTKQMMWKFLIQKGYVVEDRSYYGNSYDYKLSKKWRVALTSPDWLNLIDWGNTTEIKDDTYDKFAGTFCDSDTIKVLEGVMCTTEGETLHWEFNLDGVNLSSLILSILTSAEESNEH